MIRYFMTYQDAVDHDVRTDISKNFNLIKEGVFIKVPENGNFNLKKAPLLRNIPDMEKYLEDAKYLGEELLIEIPENKLDNVPEEIVRKFKELDGGNYKQLEKVYELKNLILLDIGALKFIPNKKDARLIMASRANKEGLLSLKQVSELIARAGENKEIREAIEQSGIGAGLYITAPADLIEKHLSWATEFSEINPGVYQVKNKLHLIFKEGLLTKIDNNKLNGRAVYITEKPLKIYLEGEEEIPADAEKYFIARRENLEPTTIDVYKEYFKVIKQNENGFQTINIDRLSN